MKLSSLTDGIFKNNAIFRQMLGLCPTLAVTTTLSNAIGMGGATILVLCASNVAISVFRNVIPPQVRIPVYVLIIASIVTVVDLLMNSYLHDLHKVLGLFVPLIVVNCVVLGRAESFASKNNIFDSFLDGLGSGIGFTLALCLLASVRELLGSGSLLGINITGDVLPPVILFVLPPGAFIVLGFLFAGLNLIKRQRAV